VEHFVYPRDHRVCSLRSHECNHFKLNLCMRFQDPKVLSHASMDRIFFRVLLHPSFPKLTLHCRDVQDKLPHFTKIYKGARLTVMFSGIKICVLSSMPIRPYP
jgi:hypothetical protein